MIDTLRLIARRGHRPHDGIQSTFFAEAFVKGVIFFDRDRDKKNFQRLVPISELIRQEVDLYLARHPGLARSSPHFPSDGVPSRPTSVSDLIQRLHAAEELVRDEGHEREVPVLYDSAFHGYRGFRATEMENNQHRTAHVNFIIGWSCKLGSAKEDRYVMHDGRLLYAAVEGRRPVEIEEEYQQAKAPLEEENSLLRRQNEELGTRLAQMEQKNTALGTQLERMEGQMERMERLLDRMSSS